MSKNTKLVILTVLNIILYASCCTPVKLIDPTLQPYFDSYNKIVDDVCPKLRSNYPKQIIIRFNHSTDNVIGKCISNPFRFIILIDRKYWDEGSDSAKLALIYHELGHCVLGLDHTNDPRHYMFPTAEDFLYSYEVRYQVAKDIEKKCQEN